MSTSEVPEPDEGADDELPRRFLIFTCPDFDQNEDKAREASAAIDSILSGILGRVCELEHIEQALREAELTSARARLAREQLLRVLGETDGLVNGVSNAHDALIFHWNTTTMTSVSR
jgi:hypothetical protein